MKQSWDTPLTIRNRDRMVRQLEQQGLYEPVVLEVMRQLPRHIFTDVGMEHLAYQEQTVHISHRQTLSRPTTVARMTSLAFMGKMNKGLGKTLEIGAGTGYQSAVLGKLASYVVGVERIEPLVKQAKLRMKQLAMRNVEQIWSDGSAADSSWTKGQYDTIVVSACLQLTPNPWIEKIAPNGCLVVPELLGTDPKGPQEIVVYQHLPSQGITRTVIEACDFVPVLSGTVGNRS